MYKANGFIHFFIGLANNKYMSIGLIVLSIIILISLMSLRLSIQLQYDALSNNGVIKIKLFDIITIYSAKVVVINNYLSLNNKKNKVVLIKFDLEDENFLLLERIAKEVIEKIYPLRVTTNTNICLEHPMIASLASATTNLLISRLYNRLQNYNPDIVLNNYTFVGFRHNIIDIDIKCVFIITLFDFLWAFIKTLSNLRGEYEKQDIQPTQN